jgi:hypothetical protein
MPDTAKFEAHHMVGARGIECVLYLVDVAGHGLNLEQQAPRFVHHPETVIDIDRMGVERHRFAQRHLVGVDLPIPLPAGDVDDGRRRRHGKGPGSKRKRGDDDADGRETHDEPFAP